MSALQLEVGAKEDFILLVRNNLQDPSPQSSTAGKYMCYGVGPIAENFYTTGIKFDNTEMVKMANNFDYAQDLSVREKKDEERNEPIAKKRKQTQVEVDGEAGKPKKAKKPVPTARPEKVVENSSGSDENDVTNDATNSNKVVDAERAKKKTKKFIPKKVFTPGSFIDNQSVENSSDSDEDVAGSNDETISGKVANAGRAEKQTKKPRPGSFIENLTVTTSESDSDEH